MIHDKGTAEKFAYGNQKWDSLLAGAYSSWDAGVCTCSDAPSSIIDSVYVRW